MSSSRVVDATPINLKERIAALQQLSTASNPPPSPSFSTKNDVSPSPTAATNANIKLREKIARFEKKGGVPVPRGSFGLGAPPPQDGHTKRQGELYGNRIPQPVRVASGPQGTSSPSGHSHPPSASVKPRGNNRRSYSLSSVNTLMASEFAGGVDAPLTSSAEEPVHQSSVLSAEPPATLNLQDEQGQSPIGSPLPAIVISQGEGDSITETTQVPLEQAAQEAAEVDAEVPRSPENVTTRSTHSTDLDTPPTLPSSDDLTDNPSLSSSPQSVLSTSQQELDATSPVSPILTPIPATHEAPLQAVGLGSPLTGSDSLQRASDDESVSNNDESNISHSTTTGVALESSQPVSDGLTAFPHTAKKIDQKETFGAQTTVRVDEDEADIKGRKVPLSSLDLDSGTTILQSSAHNAVSTSQQRPSKEGAESTQPAGAAAVESDIPSSPTTPHATQIFLPETSSSFTQSPSSPEQRSRYGTSVRPANTTEIVPNPSHSQPAPKEAESERGSVKILDHQADSSRQNLSSNRAGAQNKWRNDQVNSRSLVPNTPETRQASSAPVLGNGATTPMPSLPAIPATSGHDLSDLLQSAFLLEQTLESGGLLTEPDVPVIVTDDDDISHEVVTTTPDGVEVRRLSKGEAEENKRTLEKLQAKREEQAKSKLRSSFRNTLTRAVGGGNNGATSGGDVTASFDTGDSITASRQEQQPQYYSKRFKSPSVPHLLDSTPDTGLARSKTPEIHFGKAHKPPSLTSSKSAKSRFPNFRRLTSPSKSPEGHGGRHDRSSFSTSSEISSEDSSPAVLTPPDVATEFGEGVKGTKGYGNSWQGMSQKKGKDGMSRAATFAGKIWARARTRSGASTLSTQSSLGRTSSETPPLLPPLPDIILPAESAENTPLVKPPARSTSLSPRSSQFIPPSPSPDTSLSLSFDTEGTGSSTPVQSFKHSNSLSPESTAHTSYSRRRSELPPNSTSSPPSIRPLSWMSASSSGSHVNSPLMLDSDFFDAFPSVPENQALVLSPPDTSSSYSRSQARTAPMTSRTAQSSDK